MSIFFRYPIPTATGGISTSNLEVAPYTKVHTFTANGSFTPTVDTFVDVLAIGGGGIGGPSPNNPGGGGGAGAIVYRKFIRLNQSTPYPITIGGVGASTVVSLGTTTITAPTGGSGAAGQAGSAVPGGSAPLASGGGGAGWANGPGGTGAGVFGVGFPGYRGFSPQSGSGGGGAGSGGPIEASSVTGGLGAPIAYFTNNPVDIVAFGGNGGNSVSSRPATAYGSGQPGFPLSTPGIPGAVYIKY